MNEQSPKSPELAEIIAKAKELGVSIKKGINKLIADISAKLPKSDANSTPPAPPESPKAAPRPPVDTPVNPPQETKPPKNDSEKPE